MVTVSFFLARLSQSLKEGQTDLKRVLLILRSIAQEGLDVGLYD